MNLVIDYGNTAAKVGIFEGSGLKEFQIFKDEHTLKNFLENFLADAIIISSVSVPAKRVAEWALKTEKKIILDHKLPLPVKNKYATPETLGVDRLAGVCGAQQIFPNTNCLVIDAGTCITYDFLDEDSNYLGGGISPGLKMRFEALHNFTARLPLVNAVENPDLIGNSTESCIQSGIIIGLLAEMEGVIQQYQKKFKGLRVILCGGDAPFFENKLKAPIFASPELVLSGLNSILQYNVRN